MTRFIRFILGVLVIGFFVLPVRAAFSSLYVFGDSISTTTNGPGTAYYYGKRYTNGRVWVEVLSQWHGLSYDSNKNWSYYGQYSSNLVANVSQFNAADASTALFAVWVCNADFVDFIARVYPSTNLVTWTTNINQSLTNHFKAVTNLYTKGVRTLVLPNAVDVMKIPQYNTRPAAQKSFIRQRVIDYNASLSTAWLAQIQANCPDLVIHFVDIFTMLDDVVANAANYGLTNALYAGQSIDVIQDPALLDKSLTGPGTNYIFWDYQAPTAKFHMWIADAVQRALSFPQITGIACLGPSNRLDLANVPIGRNGFVEGRTNLTLGSWTSLTGFDSSNAAQSVFVPVSGPMQFYRLRLPFVWTWP